jgi:hypothetical protein
MTRRELIAALEAIDCPDETPVMCEQDELGDPDDIGDRLELRHIFRTSFDGYNPKWKEYSYGHPRKRYDQFIYEFDAIVIYWKPDYTWQKDKK